MSTVIKTKVLVSPDAIFNAAIETNEILLDNFQVAKIVLACGDGAVANATATIEATNEDESTTTVLETREVAIGTKNIHEFTIDAATLAHDELDRIKLKVTNAGKADYVGTVFAVLTNERYSE